MRHSINCLVSTQRVRTLANSRSDLTQSKEWCSSCDITSLKCRLMQGPTLQNSYWLLGFLDRKNITHIILSLFFLFIITCWMLVLVTSFSFRKFKDVFACFTRDVFQSLFFSVKHYLFYRELQFEAVLCWWSWGAENRTKRQWRGHGSSLVKGWLSFTPVLMLPIDNFFSFSKFQIFQNSKLSLSEYSKLFPVVLVDLQNGLLSIHSFWLFGCL